jgi:hypothetical protein
MRLRNINHSDCIDMIGTAHTHILLLPMSVAMRVATHMIIFSCCKVRPVNVRNMNTCSFYWMYYG